VKLAVVAGVAVIGAAGAWVFALRQHRPPPSTHVHHVAHAPHVPTLAVQPPNTVAISGVVYDDRAVPVAGVDVIARADGVEIRATTDADGAWIAAVPRGTYRIYVRGAHVLSAGVPDHPRIDAPQTARAIGVADEGLMPALVVAGDTPDLELEVVRAATIAGSIADDGNGAAPGALVHAKSTNARGLAPVLGTDTAVTGPDGSFELVVPAGSYVLEVSRADRTTLVTDEATTVEPGGSADVEATLTRGCQITGHIVDADGHPANDGDIWLANESAAFHSAGRADGDGAFRVTTDEVGQLFLRAWIWRAGPSWVRSVHCDAGTVLTGINLALSNSSPEIEGIVVDMAGERVPFANVDIDPVATGALHQEERTSADGSYRVFEAPVGDYWLTATAPGRGVVTQLVQMFGPVQLALGGTGRIAGTVTGIANGSLEIRFDGCAELHDIAIAHEPQIVPVIGGRFAIDGAPACRLALAVRWRGTEIDVDVAVAANSTSIVELELGKPTEKLVHGVVRDAAGRPVALARIGARLGDRVLDSVSSDADGRFSLHAVAGAELTSGTGRATVGLANVADEEVDLELSSK
jgi:hypothetical protein